MNTRAESPGANALIGQTSELFLEGVRVGSVILRDYMGNDQSIINAARISYTKQPAKKDDTRLMHYLWKHRHTSPFEQVVLTLQINCPIFVARQWLRHRTLSANEESARYSELGADAYVPGVTRLRRQSTINKQATGDELIENPQGAIALITNANQHSFETYEQLLRAGVSREVARTVVPVGTMTNFVFTQSLHNLLHWHRLRADSHAQPEIRVYAEAIGEIIKAGWPTVWDAYQRYRTWTIDEEALAQLDEETREQLRKIGIQL